MRMKLISLLVGAGTFMLAATVASEVAAFVPSGGWAKCCIKYYDHNYEDKGNDHVIGQLTERINAMELAIIEALRLGTGQLSGNLKEQIGSDSNLANTQDDRSVVARVEDARLQAMTDAASGASSCNVITGSMGVTGMQAGSQDFVADLSEDLSDWNVGDGDMPSSEGTDVAIQSRVGLHCRLYANEQDVRAGLCESVGELQNANLNARASLYYHTKGNTSLTLGEDRVQAAHAFLLNAINPKPMGAMLPDEANTAGGRELAAERQTDAARMSIAEEAAGDILSKRTPQAEGEYVSFVQETAAQIPGYKGDFSEGVSWTDYMDVRARSWHMNPRFLSTMDTNNPGQAIKDLTQIQAFNAYLGWETYRLLEKQNLILATMLAIQTEGARAN